MTKTKTGTCACGTIASRRKSGQWCCELCIMKDEARIAENRSEGNHRRGTGAKKKEGVSQFASEKARARQ